MENGPRRRGSIHRPEYRHLLAQLRKARIAAGLTQEQAGRALHRPKSFISKCELGERRIDPIDLMDFAAVYGKSITYFLPPRNTPHTKARA
jgi:transcriptional regulator with XRE-family HTH domain